MDNTINIDFDDISMYESIEINKEDLNAVERPSLTYWKDAWIRLSKNKVALISFGVILLYIILAVVGP